MPNFRSLPAPLQNLTEALSRLPGVGKRTAERLTLALLEWPEEQLCSLGENLIQLRQRIHPCRQCGNYSEDELCGICTSPQRQNNIICVVETAAQIRVIENSGSYHGLYHVLGGRLSPLNGKGPEDLRLPELRTRLQTGSVSELILATSPDVDGEATAHFLTQEFASLPLTISRIASGIPAGADLSYADAATLSMALSGRRKIN
ncbi:MAG: recombination protein RecR [Lentisphaerae bacterium]|jgi:recombination protein RecR|nr:recombination protein RecR [Lentisphaerota bacterium]